MSSLQPKPVAQQPVKEDPYLTEFVTASGNFVKGPTLDQAKEKVEKMLKKFNPEEWWAQKICRSRQGKEDHLMAYIIRDFSKEHERTDMAKFREDQFWFGREEYIVPQMKTDTDNHSDTFNQRIPEVLPFRDATDKIRYYPVMEKKTYHLYTPVNPETIKLYKALSGMTADDLETEYLFITAKGGRVVNAEDPEDIFTLSVADAKQDDRLIMRAKRQKDKAELLDQRSTKQIK